MFSLAPILKYLVCHNHATNGHPINLISGERDLLSIVKEQDLLLHVKGGTLCPHKAIFTLELDLKA